MQRILDLPEDESSSYAKQKPLAERLRPKSWEQVQGLNSHEIATINILKGGKGRPPSLIITGPPGVGKTTIAKLIGKTFDLPFKELSAVLSGIKEVREVLEESLKSSFPTILFVDEIHRFNKVQQDAFLPYLEQGKIILIGATTENPSFLVSRQSKVASKTLVKAAEAKDFLSGDNNLFYDRSGDQHYNIASAFIKSMRAGNPDDALYWGFRMIEAGEDPRFVIRRMMIFASEDIGCADPMALTLAVSTAQAFERIGMPEGRILIGDCIFYLSKATKSKESYQSMNKALEQIKQNPALSVPMHLRNN